MSPPFEIGSEKGQARKGRVGRGEHMAVRFRHPELVDGSVALLPFILPLRSHFYLPLHPNGTTPKRNERDTREASI